jgi:hypothetical protein
MTRLWSLLNGVQPIMVLLWLGLAAFSVALVILIWTRWGQYRPLRKCLMLSLLAHLLLAGYATTVEIVALAPAAPEPAMHVSLLEWPAGPGAGPNPPTEETSTSILAAAPAEDPPDRKTLSPVLPPLPPASPAEEPAPPPAVPCPLSPVPPSPVSPAEEPAPPPKQSAEPTASDPPPAESPQREAVAPSGNPPSAWTAIPVADKDVARRDENPGTAPADASGDSAAHAIPEAYRLRMSGDHLQAAVGGGGSPETEAAVQAALQWLVAGQNPDGRWEAKRHEAGRDTMTDGRSRPNTGLEADSGMTGLALLSLLGSGHTHRHGPYQQNVRRGLEYLLATQAADGSLAGQADPFAAMYCHAMAAFALSEAYGMTGDSRLEAGVRRAVAYTVDAQDPVGGGWRYRPRDPGDTSQLGWQFMALRSAELAGIPIPARTRSGIIRYLQSVAAGRCGGLASYRPREQTSRTMTAEALVCWQFLGMAPQHPAGKEAGDFLLGELPGESRPNFYYWYYATMALHQLQGEHWQRWNDALRTHLLATQQQAGPLAGSWDPDPVWGGYGGRIYSTSLATLCLEVYYRYLPLWKAGGKEGIRD